MGKYLTNPIKSFNSENQYFWFLLIIFATFISMLPLRIWGIPSGHDAHQHFQFAQIYYDSILSGNPIPGWSAFENHGFGGIGIRFYPPFAYLVLAFARIIIGNWFDATWIVFLLWTLIGSFGTYFWAREFFPLKVAGIAAILFAFSSFNLAQIYQFFIYGEFAACAILPFCFLFATRVVNREKLCDIVFLSISYALLILSHIPLTLIVSISLVIYTGAILNWRKAVKPLLKLILAASLGLCASSFHLAKMMPEMSWLNHNSPEFSTGIYSYQNYFFPYSLTFKENFWATFVWLLFFVTVISTISLFVPVIFSWFRKSEANPLKVFRGGIVTGLAAFVMATPLSSIIWQTFPALQKTQFPWRWFSIVSVVGAIAFAAFFVPLMQKHQNKRVTPHLIFFFFFGLLFFNYTQIIIPSVPKDREKFENFVGNLLTDESFDCWWTIWAKNEAFGVSEKVTAESRQVKIIDWQPEFREFEVADGEPINARIATFYYPHWQATVDGKKVEIDKAADGTILIPIPNKKAEVKLFFSESSVVRAAKVVSLGIWLSFAIIIGLLWFKRKFSLGKTNQ